MGIMGWLKKGKDDIRVEEVGAPVRDSLILVCEKCGLKQQGDADDNPSRGLQKAIKRRLSADSRKSDVRAMLSSCMNLCPKEKVSVCLVRFGSKEPTTRFFELSLAQDLEATADVLLKTLDQV